jgi:glycerophosphoryl diester phosphodiesterase
MKLAWDRGAKAAECDIMLTRDKKVIVFHDKKGNRLTGNGFVVKDALYDDIKNYPIALRETNDPRFKGETIPLLQELLKILPEQCTLVIEIKTGPEILPYMQKVIDEYWKSGNIAFIAFDFETILYTKELYPDVPCYYLSSFKADLKSRYRKIVESELDGVNLRHSIITRKIVDTYKSADKDVWCWTVNEPEDARKMIDLGVSAITTDRPVWLREQVQ